MKWTKKEDKKIIKLWNDGVKMKDISNMIENRTSNAIMNRMATLRKEGKIITRHKSKRFHPYKYGKPTNTRLGLPMQQQPVIDKTSTSFKIVETMIDIEKFLLLKNKQYGDSALQPVRIFSKADKSEQLKVRIDDKLNRLVQGNDSIESDEDVVKDLIGYLVLLLIQMRE